MSKGSKLFEAIIQNPSDGLTKMIYADWLDEEGKYPDIAYAMRWCALMDKYPHQSPKGMIAWWSVKECQELSGDRYANNHHCLPFLVWNILPHNEIGTGHPFRVYYKGVNRAYAAVTKALIDIRSVLTCDEKLPVYITKPSSRGTLP